MPFQPIVTLTSVPRDNSAFVLTDATPTGGASGWGATNAPAGPSSITSIFGAFQYYGGVPSQSTGSSGSVATTMTFSAQLADGVITFLAYYGKVVTLVSNYTVSADGLTITCSDPSLFNIMDSVTAISLDGVVFPSSVLSFFSNTITLSTPVAANATGNTFYVYYTAQVMGLVLNNGEAICVNGISLLPIEVDANDNGMAIFNNLCLKLSAEIAFNCGNLSKAHEAALLLSGFKPSVETNCPTCG